MRYILVTLLGLATLGFTTLADTTSTYGIYPAVEIQYQSYGIGPIIVLGNSFISTTWCPPLDSVSLSFGSSTVGPFWTVGLILWNVTNPPIGLDPQIGLGYWMSPYLFGQFKMGYTGYTSVSLTVVLRF
jgi:hypothetical protein